MNKRFALITTIAALLALCGSSFSNGFAIAQKDSGKIDSTALRVKDRRDDFAARLERSIPRLMSEGDVPGLSIAVIKDSKIIWQRAFGVKSIKTKEPVDDGTIFEAASLTKPVFAYGVLKLVESGKLDLDAPLSKYLPEPYIKDDDRVKQITARMVLTHRTGFPNWRPNGQPLKIILTPGEKFSYSGEGFMYLQKVVEQITGQPINEYLAKAVFEPLGMTNSNLGWRDSYATLKAIGHNAAGNPGVMRMSKEGNSAGGLHTTTSDYAKFVIALMSGTGLKKETHREMLSPQAKVDVGCSNCISGIATGRLSTNIFWGLGVGLQQTEEGLSFWHWGDNNGEYHCYMVAFPQQKLGVVIFTNSGNGHSIIPEIISEAIGGNHPAIAWIKYESYKTPSPDKKFYRDILARGEQAISDYKESKKKGAASLMETQVNRIGYWLMGRNRMKEAIAIFKMNVEDYPDSWNAYDSLAEAYMTTGDKELAIKYYEKSLELNPKNTGGADNLKRLRGQQ